MSLPRELQPRAGWIELRPARSEDARWLYAWRRESSVRRFQPLAETSLRDLQAELERHRPSDLFRNRGERFQWVILEDGQPVGWITLVVTSWAHGVAELGYSLTTTAQGRGIMILALEQLLPTLFFSTALERIEARCAVGNVRSQRVLERLGFVREGLLRGYFVLDGRRVDNHLYALLRSDYLARTRGNAERSEEVP